MARNDPPNLDPFREFQLSEMGDKRRHEVHQDSAEIDQELQNSRFSEPRMSNSSSSNWKSEGPCRDFIRGRCYYGESGRYSHDETRMSNSSSSSWKREEPCQDFQGGRCVFGERCKYSHDKRGPFYPSLGGGGATTRMCPFFMNGQTCPFGEKCIYSHRRSSSNVARERFRKTMICKYWKYRSCNNGQECSHAHGIAELRPLPSRPHDTNAFLEPSLWSKKMQHQAQLRARQILWQQIQRRWQQILLIQGKLRAI